MADFGEDDASAQLIDAGNGGQELHRGAIGLDQSVDLRIDLVDRRVNPAPAKAGGVDLLQMQAQQEAVMPGDAAAQRCLQVGWAGFDPPVGQRCQSIGVLTCAAFASTNSNSPSERL
jgi:hypothetical protein